MYSWCFEFVNNNTEMIKERFHLVHYDVFLVYVKFLLNTFCNQTEMTHDWPSSYIDLHSNAES